MKPKIQIELTDGQAKLIEWALESGLDQHEKFLRHDDWDDCMTKKEVYEASWSDRKFKKAIKLFRDKCLR